MRLWPDSVKFAGGDRSIPASVEICIKWLAISAPSVLVVSSNKKMWSHNRFFQGGRDEYYHHQNENTFPTLAEQMVRPSSD